MAGLRYKTLTIRIEAAGEKWDDRMTVQYAMDIRDLLCSVQNPERVIELTAVDLYRRLKHGVNLP